MKNLHIFGIFLFVVVFFWQVFLKGFLPIPSDTVVGLYHPFRDLYAKEYPRGIPFKNFLITDPIRQQIPWKFLSLEIEKRSELPLWNPYNFSGAPLLANFQSGAFYPLNLLFFVLPFSTSWTILVMIQPILAGIFMFFFLSNLKLSRMASLFGAITLIGSGFFIAWSEWNNVIHTALWLPLILLSIDKVVLSSKYKVLSIWGLIFAGSLVCSLFAGHPQIFFYLFLVSLAYLIFRWFEQKKKLKSLMPFAVSSVLAVVLTAIQWFPTLQFTSLSARSIDQDYSRVEGWFIPLQHLVQFVIPDFFGNPTTLNYWGTWNYGELVGYIGIVSLVFVALSLSKNVDRTKIFFVAVVVLGLVFATENPIAKIPYALSLPLISSSQPTRLIFVIVFGLAVLAAFGFDFFIKTLKFDKRVITALLIITGVLALIWAQGVSNVLGISAENLSVSKRNLFFPSAIFGLGVILMVVRTILKNDFVQKFVPLVLVAIIAFDLLRFGWKFTPFTEVAYFYPDTRVIEFLKGDKDVFRIASTDSRIFPPNFSTFYKIQSIEGYDPLYLESYAELMAASERGEPNIRPPFGFNRIITPHNLDSKIIDLLNVKYVLSLTDLSAPRFEKVFQEGETRVYENKNVLPRVFFVDRIKRAQDKMDSISQVFKEDLTRVAIVEDNHIRNDEFAVGEARILHYSENRVEIQTQNASDGFLVLSDSFYPSWEARVDGSTTKIYKTNHAFRGILVPAGKHSVVFHATLLEL